MIRVIEIIQLFRIPDQYDRCRKLMWTNASTQNDSLNHI